MGTIGLIFGTEEYPERIRNPNNCDMEMVKGYGYYSTQEMYVKTFLSSLYSFTICEQKRIFILLGCGWWRKRLVTTLLIPQFSASFCFYPDRHSRDCTLQTLGFFTRQKRISEML